MPTAANLATGEAILGERHTSAFSDMDPLTHRRGYDAS